MTELIPLWRLQLHRLAMLVVSVIYTKFDQRRIGKKWLFLRYKTYVSWEENENGFL